MEIIQLNVKGMTCASCVAHVEKGIKKGSGIDMATVNLATEKATVSYDPGTTSLEEIIGHIEEAGYGAELFSSDDADDMARERRQKLARLKRDTLIAGLLSFPLFLAMIAMIFDIRALMILHDPLLQLLLATPVQFIIGARFYKGAWNSLKAKNPGMDLLVAMGTSSAYLLSIYNGFFSSGDHSSGLYFEASAIIITLVLLGKYFELRAKGRTSEAISKLLGLQPKSAKVQRGEEILEVPISDILPGDIILIRSGERVPVDGVVYEGATAIDESMITGESMPVEKQEGDQVLGGTVNSYGSVKITATHVGKDSVLSRIISVVEEAQGSKAPVQKLADKVASIFVPTVLGIAIVTLLVWTFGFGQLERGIISAVAVLVIACPCALGLATPTAIMVGTGIGAQRGILIRNGEVLQRSEKITAVVLDKTGTITRGKPVLQGIYRLVEEVSEQELLRVASSLEEGSEHPLARAIGEAAEDRGLTPLKVEGFKAIPGKGVAGSIEGKEYLLGTQSFLTENGIELGSIQEKKNSLEKEGKTVVILSERTKVLGLLTIADSIKPTAPQGVKMLRDLGLEVYMITGDNRRTAEAIARKVGIEDVLAEVLPEGKAEKVAELQKLGHTVAMAGDGINDAPALATADTGFAMGEGSDIAIESGDITLMRGDIREIATAIALSRRTMGKIRQNLFWAFFYNSIGIPFAAIGLLSPIIAGAAMAFSSVSVVTNSLSLKKFTMKGIDGRAMNREQSPRDSESSQEGEEKMIMNVEGMSCNHCKMAVEKAVKSVEGVRDAQVSLEEKSVSIITEKEKPGLEERIREAIREAGYEPVG